MYKKWNVYGKGSVIDPSNKKILFIRHGESEAYVNIAATHTSKVHLTSYGKQQASEIAHRFCCAPSRIISSHYARARETAQPTIDLFPDTPWELLPAEEFTYLGSLNGVSCTMQERRALVQDYWKRCDPWYRDGCGESFVMFIKRVRAVLDEIWKQPDSVVVFTHEQFMIAVQGLLEGWISDVPTEKEMRRFKEKLLKKELSHPYGQVLELPEALDERKHLVLRDLSPVGV
jgi:broad specificity phosphatase PhoE